MIGPRWARRWKFNGSKAMSLRGATGRDANRLDRGDEAIPSKVAIAPSEGDCFVGLRPPRNDILDY